MSDAKSRQNKGGPSRLKFLLTVVVLAVVGVAVYGMIKPIETVEVRKQIAL